MPAGYRLLSLNFVHRVITITSATKHLDKNEGGHWERVVPTLLNAALSSVFWF